MLAVSIYFSESVHLEKNKTIGFHFNLFFHPCKLNSGVKIVFFLSCYILIVLSLFSSELIFKEVLDWEERMKNGVIRGQPSPIG